MTPSINKVDQELSETDKNYLLAREAAKNLYSKLFTICAIRGLNGIRHDEWVKYQEKLR